MIAGMSWFDVTIVGLVWFGAGLIWGAFLQRWMSRR